MQTLSAGQTWSNYRVEAYLGGGGQADVYLVRHAELGVTRALKVLKQTGDDVTARLVHEGQVQATLMHPNLVPVLELIRVHGHAALVMDYIEGPTLDELLDRGPLTFEQIDYLARGMLDGVIAAHRRGVVHRDLKPSNVMLDVRDEPPVARITDFGLAKALIGEVGEAGATGTASGVVMGTPRYMAPEQMTDAKSVDERADVWSMGAVLFELVTGAVAFPGDSLVETLRAVDRGEFPPVTDLRPDVPARMALAIEEALVREVEDRCPTMQALRDLWVGQDRHIDPPVFELEGVGSGPTALPDDDSAVPADSYDAGPSGLQGASTLRPRDSMASLDPETAAALHQAQRRMTQVGLGAAGVGLIAVIAILAAVWIALWGGAAPDDVAAVVDPAIEVEAPRADDPQPDGAAPDAGTEDAVAASEPPEAAAPVVDPAPAPVAAPPPKTTTITTKTTSRPPPTPKPPPVEPPAEPVEMGAWKPVWVGEANAQVMLKGDDGVFHLAVGPGPYQVPAGTYEIHVQQFGARPARTGEVTVVAGKTAAFQCHSGSGICG